MDSKNYRGVIYLDKLIYKNNMEEMKEAYNELADEIDYIRDKNDNFAVINDLKTKFKNPQNMKYTVRNVNGYTSLLEWEHEENEMALYIDCGDLCRSKVDSRVKNPFAAIITHNHYDHNNILYKYHGNKKIYKEPIIKPDNYIYGYNRPIEYEVNNKKVGYYSPINIRNIVNNKDKTTLLVNLVTKAEKDSVYHNEPIYLDDSKNIRLYYPKYNTNKQNTNSLAIVIEGEKEKVFYPGDAKFYMYKGILEKESFTNDTKDDGKSKTYIVPHHGGDIGTYNIDVLKEKVKIIVNRCSLNSSSREFFDNCKKLHTLKAKSEGNDGLVIMSLNTKNCESCGEGKNCTYCERLLKCFNECKFEVCNEHKNVNKYTLGSENF